MHFGVRLRPSVRRFRGFFLQNTFQTWFLNLCEIRGTTRTVFKISDMNFQNLIFEGLFWKLGQQKTSQIEEMASKNEL